MELKHMLQKFNYWSIGNGKDINAWNEACIEEDFRINEHVDIPPHLNNMNVSDLVDGEG
jgi:hypothetical protein